MNAHEALRQLEGAIGALRYQVMADVDAGRVDMEWLNAVSDDIDESIAVIESSISKEPEKIPIDEYVRISLGWGDKKTLDS